MRKKILVVEDDEHQRYMLKVALEGAGYSVVMALSAEQALSYMKVAPVDLVILDVMLAGHMDGLQALSALKETEVPDTTPVIVVSAHLSDQRIRELLEAGAVLYMAKPYDIHILLKSVRGILAAQEEQLCPS